MSNKLDNLNKILDFLNENNGETIYKISNRSKLGWETAKNNLEILKNLGLVIEKKEKFYTNKKINKTYFNLPLTKEQESLSNFLFNKIKKILNSKNIEVLNLKIQKIAYEVIKNLNLNIPTGLYKQGAISIYGDYENIIIDNNFENDFIAKIENEINNELNTTFKNTLYGNGFVLKQYEKHKEQEIFRLYLEKFNLIKNLNKKENYEIIIENFLSFQRFLPNEIFFEFENNIFKIIIGLLLNEKFKEHYDYLSPFLENTFSSFWDSFSLKNFEKTLFEDKKIILTKEELNNYFKTNYELKKETLEYNLETLKEELSKCENQNS